MTEENRKKTRTGTRNGFGIFAYILTSAILALAVGLCLIVSIQVATRGYVDVFGCSVFRVVTGSMEPTIRAGEAILSRKTDPEKLEVGDIVCYRSTVTEIRGSVVTHRIVGIHHIQDGTLYLETRGDANMTSDPVMVHADQLIGRVIWISGSENFLTDLLSFVTGKLGFLACVVLPVILAAGLILHSAVRNLRTQIRTLSAAQPQQDPLDELLPGYTTLTRRDYEEIYTSLRDELLKELGHDISMEKTDIGPDGGGTAGS